MCCDSIVTTPHLAPGPWVPSGIIAVLRSDEEMDYRPVIDALLAGGVRVVELTLTSPSVCAEIPRILDHFDGAELDIGVGTVTGDEQADLAIDAGAQFIVTPACLPSVVVRSVERGVPVVPGAFTPTEAMIQWQAGATAIKVFPAAVLGPSFVSHLHGPFPSMPMVPSGGLRVEDVRPWLDAGAVAISLGGVLTGDALRGGDLTDLTNRARAAVSALAPTGD